MLWSFQQKMWLYRTPIDFRAQIDGLVVIISAELKQKPTSGELFIFRNKTANKIKMLLWDDNGFWLLYKRLEKNRFIFPAINAESMTITRDQLQLLLAGGDFEKQQFFTKISAKKFY